MSINFVTLAQSPARLVAIVCAAQVPGADWRLLLAFAAARHDPTLAALQQ
jgi:hypothetical protein